MNISPRYRFRPDAAAGESGTVSAVLGPTNTGKTHLAVERMLGHASGMIGLPLRLLAREIYDRVVRLRGAASVALITGEEKILPPRPAYYVCTVESMPLAIEVEFLAVDEIQLCADNERGHIFTDRLLNARGRRETMFLGSPTMAPLIRQLLPQASFITRPRFSNLSYAGSHKLGRMPRRSAIVAFSSDEVYGIAELIRRQRGGAAVVMGALSPRTRNAQVALYQSGDVDFLVATDAIGMGINMDVQHVAFASLSKFDGISHRNLHPVEVSQIAGRAGRYLNDGTFGVTGDAGQMDDELIRRVENHQFQPLRNIKWRNSALDFGSSARLLASLETQPILPGLHRAREADDMIVLRNLLSDSEIIRLSSAPDTLQRLWNICQVPDFRKVGPDIHARMLGALFRHLMSARGVLPTDEVARQVDRLDRIDGDIDTLSTRIAHTRTWTFITNRNGWLDDTAYWRGRTREIEDRLSDALHERLTQRFIDRRTSVLMRRLHQKERLMATLTPEGFVLIEGEFAGRLEGFRFAVDATADGMHLRTLRNAATQALQSEIEARAFRLERHARIDDGKVIAIGEDCIIRWEGMAVARLIGGHDVLNPQIELLADPELLSGPAEISVREAIAGWLTRYIAKVMEPLITLQNSPEVTGLSKGLVFQLGEAMGVLARASVTGLVKGIEQLERGKLRKLGVRFGERHIFMPAMLKPAPTALKLRLWRAANNITQEIVAPGAGLSSTPARDDAPQGFYNIVGYEVCGPRAIRIDMLERLLVQLRQKNSPDGFPLTAGLWSPVGCGVSDFEAVMRALGYAPFERPAGAVTQSNLPPAEPAGEAEAAYQPNQQAAELVIEDAAAQETPCAPAPIEAETNIAAQTPPAPLVLWKFQTRHKPARAQQKYAGEKHDGAGIKDAGSPARNSRPRKNKTERSRNSVSIPLSEAAPRPTRPPRPAAKLSRNIPLDAKSSHQDRPARTPQPAQPRVQAEKQIDPDSPFAKLLALKERMQKSS